MHASDYASAFASRIYPGPPRAGFLRPGRRGRQWCRLHHAAGAAGLRARPAAATAPRGEGWGVFSGTSAAAPQLAGVCALLLSKNPGLTPSDLKSVLRASARDVVLGAANAASNENRGGMPAGTGADGATGAGLVDAFAAWRLV